MGKWELIAERRTDGLTIDEPSSQNSETIEDSASDTGADADESTEGRER